MYVGGNPWCGLPAVFYSVCGLLNDGSYLLSTHSWTANKELDTLGSVEQGHGVDTQGLAFVFIIMSP